MYLIFDFELWVYTEINIQRHLLKEVIPGLVTIFMSAIRTKFQGVQLLFDLIRYSPSVRSYNSNFFLLAYF